MTAGTESEAEQEEAPDPLIGQVLQDRYKIIRKIGEGGMGAVYEGEHVAIRKRVAIKCLHANLARNKDIVTRFHREALAATQIGNEHIIECTDFGNLADGTTFMVLEFLAGSELEELIDTTGALPISRSIHIVDQMCDALAAAHEKGIIHRDLKPANVYLIKRGTDSDFVKILDFGISKFRDAADGGSGMTRTGMAMGTPYYMSPEQIEGVKDLDQRADLYAIGVILFRLLAGELPFTAESFTSLAMKIVTASPPPLRSLRGDVPAELEAIVNKLLAKKRDDRFPDCASLKAALEPFRGLNQTPSRTTASSPAGVTGAGVTGAGVTDTTNAGTTSAGVTNAGTTNAGVTNAGVTNAGVTGAGVTNAGVTSAPVLATTGDAVGVKPLEPASMGSTGTQPTSAAGNAGKPSPMVMYGGIGGGVVVLGLVIALATGAFKSKPAAAAPPKTSSTTPATVVTDAGSARVAVVADTGSAEEEAEETVHVKITALPGEAVLMLNGRRYSNPFEGELPKDDDQPTRVDVSLMGYTTITQDLWLNVPQTLKITLKSGSGIDDQRGRPAAATPADAGASEEEDDSDE